jgi:hypothetical protein
MRHTRRHQRLVVKLLVRPAPSTGPGPATASGHVAPRHKMPVLPGVTPAITNPQPTTIRLRKRSSQSYRPEGAWFRWCGTSAPFCCQRVGSSCRVCSVFRAGGIGRSVGWAGPGSG